jgi:hypothetical protein
MLLASQAMYGFSQYWCGLEKQRATDLPMKTHLLLAITVAVAFPLIGIAAEPNTDQSSQNAEMNKLLSEMNSAPADQKVGAIVTLLNKLVEQQKTTQEQNPAPKEEKKMCMCCDMMKSDQGGQKSDQSEHSHQH